MHHYLVPQSKNPVFTKKIQRVRFELTRAQTQLLALQVFLKAVPLTTLAPLLRYNYIELQFFAAKKIVFNVMKNERESIVLNQAQTIAISIFARKAQACFDNIEIDAKSHCSCESKHKKSGSNQP